MRSAAGKIESSNLRELGHMSGRNGSEDEGVLEFGVPTLNIYMFRRLS